jgi:ATP-dependent Lon protease
MKGKKGLTLTGQLGDVMKESATAALSFIRANAKRLGVDEEFFRRA